MPVPVTRKLTKEEVLASRVFWRENIAPGPTNPAWQIGEIVDYNGTLYRALVVNAGREFVPAEWEEVTDESVLFNTTAIDKIQVAYTPTSTMPSKNFAQLMRGLEYPGVQVTGLPFAEGYRIPTGPLRDYDDTAISRNVLFLPFDTIQKSIVSQDQKLFGLGSGSFALGRYLQLTAEPLYPALDNLDFTVEFFVRLTELTTETKQVLLDLRNSTSPVNPELVIYKNERNELAVSHSTLTTAIATGGTLTKNLWQHVAIVRASQLLKIFLNGTLTATLMLDDPTVYEATSITIGADFDGLNPTFGNIDELRITKGIARYFDSFSVPAEAFPRDIFTDAHFNRVIFLSGFESLEAIPEDFDESNFHTPLAVYGSTTNVRDYSADVKIVSLLDNATIDDSKTGWGKALNMTDGYAYVPANDDFAFGIFDFTIEFWCNLFGPTTTGAGVIFDTSDPSTTNGLKIWHDRDNNKLCVSINGQVLLTSLVTFDPTDSDWHFVSVEQKDSIVYLYVDGTMQALNDEITLITGTQCYIGISTELTDAAEGLLDDLRVTTDLSRHVQIQKIDSELTSLFTNATLGTASEEVITVGGGFVDTHSSHSPEELVPGITYDSADIKVYSIPGDDYDGNGAGIPITLQEYLVVDSSNTYAYTSVRGEADNLLVYSKQQGLLEEDTDYTVDRTDKIITISKLLAAGDVILIYAYDNGGGRKLSNISKIYTSGTQEFFVKYPYDATNITLVLVNGEHTHNFTVTAGLTAETEYETRVVVLDPLTADDWVSVYLYKEPISPIPYAYVNRDTYVISNILTTTYPVSAPVIKTGVPSACLVVNLDGIRLRPAEMTYAVGDGFFTSVVMSVESFADPFAIPDNEINVYVNGVLQTITTDYTIEAGVYVPPMTRSIIFPASVPLGALVEIEITTYADYTVVGDDVVFNPALMNLIGSDPGDIADIGSVIDIFNFVNNDYCKTETYTYVGGTLTSVVVPSGFDGATYDFDVYDEVTTTIISTAVFTLPREVTQGSYLWVTLNGIRLHDVIDYYVSGNQLIFNTNIPVTPTDVVIVTSLTENIATPAIGFRIWTDMLQNVGYYRISAAGTTKLTQALGLGDDMIHLEDLSGLLIPVPIQNIRGVLFINGERITYLYIDFDAKTVSGLMRGTWGTPVVDDHPVGSRVEGAASNEVLPGSPHATIWETSDLTGWTNYGLQNSTSSIATFLSDGQAILPS